jgi:hypothetical protein
MKDLKSEKKLARKDLRKTIPHHKKTKYINHKVVRNCCVS